MPEYTKAGIGTGIGRGAGRFSQALRDVLLAQQQRQGRTEEMGFRRKQAAADRSFRERQAADTASYREESLDLERERIEQARGVREATERRHATERMDELRRTGYNPVDISHSSLPDQARLPGAGKYAQAMIEELREGPPRVMAGEYDPTRDVELQRSLELVWARGGEQRRTERVRNESTPESPPKFTRHGMRFPYTPEGIEAAGEAGRRISGEADLEERRQALVAAAVQRLTDPEIGKLPSRISSYQLQPVLNEMRQRGASLEDIQYVRDYFERE